MDEIFGLDRPELLEMLSITMKQIQDWIVIADTSGRIIYVNKQVQRVLGYSKEEIIGEHTTILKSDKMPDQTYEDLWNKLLNGEHFYGVLANEDKDGNVFYLASTVSPIYNKDGEIRCFISIGKDITKNNELRQELNKIINYDSLTQLPNRIAFMKHIDEVECFKKKSAILVISFKNLNLANNTYGFKHGDEVIKTIANSIKKVLNKNHILSRIDNHTFAILIHEFKNLSDIISLVYKIEKKVGPHVNFNEEEIYIKLSIGIAVSPEDATDGAELLARAQTALTKLENEGSTYTYAFYAPEMHEEVLEQLQIENEIFKAYENDEFIPFFQPFIDLKTGKICGFEALMRRKNSLEEIILPSNFIGVLEQMGLIEEIELIFIEKVCYQIKEWLEEGYDVVPVAINISPLQFTNKNLVESITDIIDKTGIPQKYIAIEITESLFMEDIELAKSILNELKDKGFTISIDDFGTGYSSFTYLKEFNADHLKIDISFIEGVTRNKDDRAIIEAIVMVAKTLKMKTVAEGIEDIEQLRIISELGCDIGQGHYWGVALPGNKIAKKYL